MRVALLLFVLILVGSFPFLSEWISGRQATHDDSNLENIISNYINNHPEQIIESVKNYHQKEIEQNMTEYYKESVKVNAESLRDLSHPNVGENDINLIVEFFNYECGYCKKSFQVTSKLVEEFSDNNLRYIFRPLSNPNSPGSIIASKSVMSVFILEPSKFFEFHEYLMHLDSYDENTINSKVADMGIEIEDFISIRDGHKVEAMLNETMNLMINLGLSGTPSFVVNDKVIVGLQSYDKFTDMFE